MPIKFKCPGCGRRYSVPEEKAGSSGRCRRCGERFTVPVPESTIPETDAQEQTQAPVSPEPPAVEAASPRSRIGRRASAGRRASRLWLKVTLGVLGVAILAGAGVYLVPRLGRTLPGAVKEDMEASIGEAGRAEPTLLPGEAIPLSQGQALGAIVSVEQEEDLEDFIVHYTWNDSPTWDVKNRCLMLAGLREEGVPDLTQAAKDFAKLVKIASRSLSMGPLSISGDWGVLVCAKLDWEPETDQDAASGAYVASIDLEPPMTTLSGTGVVVFQIFDFRKLTSPRPVSNLYMVKASF